MNGACGRPGLPAPTIQKRIGVDFCLPKLDKALHKICGESHLVYAGEEGKGLGTRLRDISVLL